MREFHAFGIVDSSAVASYQNAELKILLRTEYEWFKSKEFEELREGFVPANNNNEANNDNNNNGIDSSNGKANNSDNNKAAASGKITGLSHELNDKQQEEDKNLEACDSHTLKAKSPPQTEKVNNNNSATCDRPLLEEKSSDNDKSSSLNMNSTSVNSVKESDNNIKIDCISDLTANNSNSEDFNYHNDAQQSCDNISIQDNSDNIEKKSSLWGANHFQLVTQSHGHMQSSAEERLNDVTIREEEGKILEEILASIKEVDGFQIAVNSAIQSAYNRNEQVKAYLGDS